VTGPIAIEVLCPCRRRVCALPSSEELLVLVTEDRLGTACVSNVDLDRSSCSPTFACVVSAGLLTLVTGRGGRPLDRRTQQRRNNPASSFADISSNPPKKEKRNGARAFTKSAKKGKTEWKVHPTTHARSTRGLFQRAWSFPASVLQVPLSLEITRRGPNGPEPARPRSERSPLGTHPPTRAIAGFAPW
jgi:hypothetical protein